ncbi:MAG: hypothetical protein IH596_00900 [Bacteroidales bacterium]|nr:hypothetical protein [Bacteroidales bacterium]
MKKLLIAVLVAGLLFPALSSFSAGKGLMDPMTKGTWFINFGFGPGTNWQGAYGNGFLPAFQVAVEVGMWEVGPGIITLGGEIGGTFYSYTGTDSRYGPGTTYKYTYTEMVIAARAAYHYGWNVQGLDTYGGVAAGPRFTIFTYQLPASYTGPVIGKPSSVGYGGGPFVGASFFFNEFLGVNAELGFNITYAQIGLVFKVK